MDVIQRSDMFEAEAKKQKLRAGDYQLESVYEKDFYFDDFPDLTDEMLGGQFTFGALRTSFDPSALAMDSEPMDIDDDEEEDEGSEYHPKQSSEALELNEMEDAGELFPNKPGNFRLRDLHGHMEEYSHRFTTLWKRQVSKNGGADVLPIKKKIIADIKEVQTVLDTICLAVEDVFSAWWLLGKFDVLLSKCNLYLNALNKSNGHPTSFVSMVWSNQCLSKSFKNKNRARASNKNKMAHVNMKATVILAPGYSFAPVGPATARFYVEDEESNVQLQNNVEPIKNGSCEMGLRFCAGTRNCPQQVRLQVQGTVTNPNGQKAKVEFLSEASKKFIIITNEVQYQRSEHQLLALELFPKNQRTCSWAKFLNALQVRWMRVTRQEEESGINTSTQRRLSRDDIVYFRDTYFKSAPLSVNQEEVKQFYTFFGKVSHVYRHNPGMRKMWLQGAVWGYVCKANAEALLLGEEAGTFLFRASESEPGLFVISWLDQAGAVMHAKIPAKLLGTIHKFADYIRDRSVLAKIHQPFSVVRNSIVARRSNVEKDKILSPYYSKTPKKETKLSEGYVDLMDL